MVHINCAVCCSCVAGLSKCCNHVVETLYKISYANENRFTKLPCIRNTSCKEPETMKIRDMDNIAGEKTNIQCCQTKKLVLILEQI